jgi:hypothetical protein
VAGGQRRRRGPGCRRGRNVSAAAHEELAAGERGAEHATQLVHGRRSTGGQPRSQERVEQVRYAAALFVFASVANAAVVVVVTVVVEATDDPALAHGS